MKDVLATELAPLPLWNAVVAALAQGFALPGRGRVMAEVLVDGGADPQRPAFVAATPAGPVYVQPQDLPLGALTQSGLDADALGRLPPALADAVLSLAMNRLLSAGGEGVRRSVQSLSRCGADQMAGEECLMLRVDGGWGALAEIRVQADRAVLSALARGLLPGAPRGQWPEAIAAHVPMGCSLRLEGPTLSVARLRGLSRGDLVLTTGPQLWLCAPHARFALAHDGSNWTIGEVSMTDDLPVADHGHPVPAGDIGDVPVRLSILLAEQTMTLAELQGLSPGALLPFPPEQPETGRAVRLLANGRAIGDGHIVDVDGRPALRIARLFGQ